MSLLVKVAAGCTWLTAVALAAPFLGLGQEAHAADALGPLPVRNFQPIQQLVLTMPGDRATVLKPGALDIRVELAETSSIFSERSGANAATVQLETLRSGFFFRYGLTSRVEVGLEVPVLYRYPGFMEGLISGTERATTGVNTARVALKDAGYAFDVSRGGRTLFQGGDGSLGLGDIMLISKYQVHELSDSYPAVSVRFAVKAPTGDRSRTFGSGEADVGLGLAVDQRVGPRWMLYANVNTVFPTGRLAGLDLQPTFSGLAAAEYLLTPAFSLIAQFEYYSSPFHGTGLKLLDRGITEAAGGFNYKLRNNLVWQLYGVENLDFITGAAADFTLSSVVTYRFGP